MNNIRYLNGPNAKSRLVPAQFNISDVVSDRDVLPTSAAPVLWAQSDTQWFDSDTSKMIRPYSSIPVSQFTAFGTMALEIDNLVNLSPTMVSQLQSFANAGGKILLNPTAGGGTFSTGSILSGNQPVITVDPNAEGGVLMENPFNGGVLTPIDGAQNIVGLLAHELGHLEDSTSPSLTISSLSNTAANENVYVADSLESEGKGAYNQFQVQSEIHSANTSDLTLFSITGDPATDYGLEQMAQGAQPASATIAAYAGVFSTVSPSTNTSVNYTQYYQNAWSSYGNVAPPLALRGSNATSALIVTDGLENVTSITYTGPVIHRKRSYGYDNHKPGERDVPGIDAGNRRCVRPDRRTDRHQFPIIDGKRRYAVASPGYAG